MNHMIRSLVMELVDGRTLHVDLDFITDISMTNVSMTNVLEKTEISITFLVDNFSIEKLTHSSSPQIDNLPQLGGG